MDAIFFRDRSTQYRMENIERELLKAYTSFHPLGKEPDYEFGIATALAVATIYQGGQAPANEFVNIHNASFIVNHSLTVIYKIFFIKNQRF